MNRRALQHRQQHTDFPLPFNMSPSAPIHKYNQRYVPPCIQTKQQASAFHIAWIPSNPLFTGISINTVWQDSLYTKYSSFSLKFSSFQRREIFFIFVEFFFSQFPRVCFAISPAAPFYHLPADLCGCVCVCVGMEWGCSDCGWICWWGKGLVSLLHSYRVIAHCPRRTPGLAARRCLSTLYSLIHGEE